MTESFRIYLRPVFVILLTIALLSTTFAQILAQEATPVAETPVATEFPNPESTPDSGQEDAKGDEEEESSESSDTGITSTSSTESVKRKSELIQPLVDVGGSVIYVESTTPESCRSNSWIFVVDNIDPTITFVTMKFSDGTVLSRSIDSSWAEARVLSHTQYMLVDAWIHSELSNSPASLRLAAGPCNEPIPGGQVYDAVFRIFLYAATPGAFDDVSWTLTNGELVQVRSGSLVGLDGLTIPGLSNGRYTISFTDSTNRIKDLEIEFVVDDQAPAISAIFYRSTGNIPLVVVPRTISAGTIQDASVRVVSEDGSIDRTKLTGSDGRADFGALPNGSYLIVTTHDSYAPMYLTHQLYGAPTTLYFNMNLSAERSIRGFVADLTTNESISDATITLTLSHPLADDVFGTSDDDGNYSLRVHNNIWYVTVSAPGYLPTSAQLNLRDENLVFNALLEPVPAQTENITLQVNTSDSGSPAGATYSVMQGSTEAFSGTLDASGTVALGDLVVGTEYEVAITGTPAGYQSKTQPFTVTNGVGSWTMTLNPIPPTTQAITLEVGTSDAGSPAGATYSVMQGSTEEFRGTLDATGTVVLGDLTLGIEYEVAITGTPAGYQSKTQPFTVTNGVGTWTMTLDPMQKTDVTILVLTVDNESPEGIPYTYQIGTDPVVAGELDSTGEIPLGMILPGTFIEIDIDATGTGYMYHSYLFSVTAQQEVYDLTLALEYSLTLRVNTSDGGSPEGARYTLTRDEAVAYSGGFPESGSVTLVGMAKGTTFEVEINGEPAGYLSETNTYTVIEHHGTLVFELDPIAPASTVAVTLEVTTDDNGSPEGATYTISEVEPMASTSGLAGSTLLQITSPLTGTLPADGTVTVGDLEIGKTYRVEIAGESVGYENHTSTFTVDADSTAWQITLQALQPGETPSPSVTPSPSPIATQTPTEMPATPEPTQQPGTPTVPGDSPTPEAVTGLPSTGTGEGAVANILIALAGATTLIVAVGIALNRGKQRG